MWTANHLDSTGNPCEGCPACLEAGGSQLHAQIQQFQERARDYQRWEQRLEEHDKRVRTEEEKRELERKQAKNPIKQEWDEEGRTKAAGAKRLRQTYKEQREAVKAGYDRGLLDLQQEADRGLEVARRQFEESHTELDRAYQAAITGLTQRLTNLEAEHEQARVAFRRAVTTEREVLRVEAQRAYRELEQARQVVQRQCPHPSGESLSDTLRRWPKREGKPAPEILRCRVCHQTFNYEQLVENVNRGATNLTYSPTPVYRGGNPGGAPTHSQDPNPSLQERERGAHGGAPNPHGLLQEGVSWDQEESRREGGGSQRGGSQEPGEKGGDNSQP